MQGIFIRFFVSEGYMIQGDFRGSLQMILRLCFSAAVRLFQIQVSAVKKAAEDHFLFPKQPLC